MPLRSEARQSQDELPPLRTFHVQRQFIDVVNDHQVMVPSRLIDEPVFGHQITVEQSGALVIVELRLIDEDKIKITYPRIFAPGTWFAVTEEVVLPSILVN